MKTTIKSALAFGLLLALPDLASAQSLTRFFGFGNSTIDSGWYRNATSGGAGFDARIAAAVAAGGRGTPGGPGLMNSEVLALHFGLGALPANQPGGGTNYATSGARNAEVNLAGSGLFLGAVPTVTQINNYLATYGAADPRALYLISSGGNDVAFALDNLARRRAQRLCDHRGEQPGRRHRHLERARRALRDRAEPERRLRQRQHARAACAL